MCPSRDLVDVERVGFAGARQWRAKCAACGASRVFYLDPHTGDGPRSASNRPRPLRVCLWCHGPELYASRLNVLEEHPECTSVRQALEALGPGPHTADTIAAAMGVTRRTIDRITSRALLKLGLHFDPVDGDLADIDVEEEPDDGHRPDPRRRAH